MKKFAGGLVLVGFVLGGIFLSDSAKPAQEVQAYPDVWNEIKHDVSPRLRDIPPKHSQGPPHEIQIRHRPAQGGAIPDAALQNSAGPLVSTTGGLNIPGVGQGFSGFSVTSAPPDTNAAVGATQVVEWVNTDLAVFDKTTGSVKLGPAAGNTLWSGFGGGCETRNDGDPIAQYDKAAGRWVLAQPVFASPYMYCIAVSQTPDATGAWNRYAFPMPNFPDYPKLGVWTDAYYGTFNLFSGNNFVGVYACAFDRTSMLAGKPATAQCFQTSSTFFSLMPADLDGSTAPPSGSPEEFVALDANLASLDLWQFHVDFTTPANSTFAGPTNLAVTPFSEACNGGVCIPQSGTRELLDSLGDRLMYRLAYRNFADHQAMVASHSVNPGNGAASGARWYELDSPEGSASFTVAQQGTFAPDTNSRWMPSIAMDKSGDIALGYSVSSSGMHPAIRYTGRIPGDSAGTMESEATIIQGSGSQLRGLNRWGDYSSMAIDPSDDCTFWYANEFLPTNGTFNWSTELASFKFTGCGVAPSSDFSISASPSSRTVTQGGGAAYTVSFTALNGYTGTASLTASVSPADLSITTSFNPGSVNSANPSSSLSVSTTNATPAGTYTVTITGTDSVNSSLKHSVNVTFVVNSAGGSPDFTISAAPSSRAVKRGSPATYTVTIAPVNGYAGTVNLSVSGVPRHASASFSPASVTGGSGSSTLTVTTNSKTPTGTFTLTITGTDSSGSPSHPATVTLTVSP